MTPLPLTSRLAAAGALTALLACTASHAETSPYYLGVSESVGYDSNLYRLGDGRALPSSVKSKSDTSFSTALVGGVDQTWGRQRLTGSMSLRNNRYQHNDQLNYNGYGLNLGLDWSTINNLSGEVTASANKSLRRFDTTEQGSAVLARNIEDNRLLGGTVRLGVVTRLTAELSASRRTVDFSADAYKRNAYQQNVLSAGGRYQFSGSTSIGLALRETKTDSPRSDFGSTRTDIDLTGRWAPSDRTSVNARLSSTKADYDIQKQNNFSGTTGELRASSLVGGKLRLGARLARDTGLSYSLFSLGNFTSATNFNRTTTDARLTADYELSSKIALNASLGQSRRDLSSALTPDFVLGGSDRTLQASLGARWQPTRSVLTGCQLDRERRSVSGSVSLPYGSTAFSCYGQFTIQ